MASHTVAYLLARGVPGALAFLAIPLFTNLLAPGEYGSYALAVAALNVANAVLFQWIRLAVVRCRPVPPSPTKPFTSTIVTLWLAITGLAGLAVGLGVVVAVALPFARPIAPVLVLGWAVLATQSLFEIVGEMFRADLRPWRFMMLQLFRAASLVGLGCVFLSFGSGWTGPLIAVALGMAVGIGWAWRGDWRDARLRWDRAVAVEMFRYGAPVSLTVALAGMIYLTDRGLIAMLLGNDAAGVYAVAFDFTSQTVTLVMLALSMSAFPIAVRELETNGVEAARGPMRHNAALLLAFGAPATVGLGVLAPGLADTFFGTGYEAAADIMPLVALAALFASLKAFHFDAALQFARRTTQQVWIVLAAVGLSVGLNLVLIPTWGLTGAAVTAVLTFGFATCITAWWGRRYFPLPFPAREATTIVLASIVMGAVLFPFRDHLGPLALAGQVTGGAAVYAAILVSLNCFGIRSRMRRTLVSVVGAQPPAASSSGRRDGSEAGR
jgi:O-antigen/teichoic acid export membrane protein